MTEENIQSESKRAHSVPRNETGGDSGFSVKASPFNPVKLELGFLLLVGFVLLVIVHRISEDAKIQLSILATYGVIAMVRLIYRTQQVQTQVKTKED